MMWNEIFERYIVFLFVFVRMSGMLLFNPFFGRKSVPVILKAGLSLILSVLVTGLLPGSVGEISNLLIFMVLAMKELLIGFVTGFILQLFLSSILMAGDMIDLQLGIGMAKVYDPQSNASIPVSASILNLLFTVMFFVTGSHLNFIKMIFYSFEILPPGPGSIDFGAAEFIVSLFGNMLLLALKLALPILTVEILSEMGLGILMRTVPQINVFVVGLQLKLLVGLVLIVLLIPGYVGVFDGMTDSMFKSIESGMRLLG